MLLPFLLQLVCCPSVWMLQPTSDSSRVVASPPRPRDDSGWLQQRRGSADRNAISHTRTCSNLFPEFFKVFTASLDTVPSYIYKKLKRLSSGFNRSPGPDLTDFAQGLQLFISPLPPALFPPLVPLVPLHHRRLYIPFPSLAPRINRQFLVLFLFSSFFLCCSTFHARLAGASSLPTRVAPRGPAPAGAGRKPLSLFKWINAAMEVAGASARACERRVTDGINHRCDRVRGGERGR